MISVVLSLQYTDLRETYLNGFLECLRFSPDLNLIESYT